ncbi:LysE family transporter [Janthinobacterium lividum]|nr:LysE family transporter [Janthinobacterium lividum]
MTLSATTSHAFSVYLQGMTLGLGLIVAIGSQNAFVLRQGLRREHVGAIVLFCALADAALIAAGVLGMAHALGQRPLNPHVYLDTVLLVGSIGAQQPGALRGWFIAGASAASLLWFAALGFGACWLAPWFARPRAWQVLDGLIGVTMFVLSALLLRHALDGW